MSESVGHHCHFISQSTKTLQLKKTGSILIGKKLLHTRKDIYIDCHDCGTEYMYFHY